MSARNREVGASVHSVDNTFYYPASKALQSARIEIGLYSFERADKRLMKYKKKMSNIEKVNKEAFDTYNYLKQLRQLLLLHRHLRVFQYPV